MTELDNGARGTAWTMHTLSVLVENKPGVLVRIAGLFSRRNFQHRLAGCRADEHEEISRITIVVNCEEHPLEQVTAAEQAHQRAEDRRARAGRHGAARS